MKYQGQPTPGAAENLFYSLSAGALKSAHQSKVRLARPCILSSHKDEKSSAATLGESYDENGDTCCNTGLGYCQVSRAPETICTIQLFLLLSILTSIEYLDTLSNFNRVWMWNTCPWWLEPWKTHLKQHIDHYWWQIIGEIGHQKSNFSEPFSPVDSLRCCQGLKIICVCILIWFYWSRTISDYSWQDTAMVVTPALATHNTLPHFPDLARGARVTWRGWQGSNVVARASWHL